MIYQHDQRTIYNRYGVIVITHGNLAGRIAYYDDNDGDKAIVYLYDRLFQIDTTKYFKLPYSHFVRIELNERCYDKLQPPFDGRSYGWDRYTPVCDLCQNNVGEPLSLINDSRKNPKGDIDEFWLCPDCKTLDDLAFWKRYELNESTLLNNTPNPYKQ